jgi:hypothetical protein
MAWGVAVVAPDAGGPRELVHHARTGYLVPAGAPAPLRSAVVRLRDDAVLRRSFGRAGRRAVVGRSWTAICDELLGHYRAVVERQPVSKRAAGRACGSSSSLTSTVPAPAVCAPPCTTSARARPPADTQWSSWFPTIQRGLRNRGSQFDLTYTDHRPDDILGTATSPSSTHKEPVKTRRGCPAW